MDELVKKYLMQKYNSENPEEKVKQDYEDQKVSGWTGFADGIGQALQGKAVNLDWMNKQNQQAYDQTIGQLEQDKKSAMSDLIKQKDFEQFDPNSNASASFRQMIKTQFPNVAESYGEMFNNISAADSEAIFKPLQLKENIEARKEQARILSQDKAMAREEKAKANSLKQRELNVTQSKQMGNYNIGLEAEKQYRQSVNTNSGVFDGGYNPTNSGQIIDNSSWAPNLLKNKDAIAAQSAANSWIETFLRDASGAAIPDTERAAYGEIYFPQPGDTPEVVSNKQKLREQKMQNAAITAGIEPNFNFEKPKSKKLVGKKFNQVANKTKFIYDDGSEEVVDGRK